MLNAFPTLLAFALIGPFILRITLGLVFVISGYIKMSGKRGGFASLFEEIGFPAPAFLVVITGLVEIVGGLCLIAGFGTQVAAMVFAVLSAVALFVKIRKGDLHKQTLGFYLFALVISISLIFSGAGFLALDLPL